MTRAKRFLYVPWRKSQFMITKDDATKNSTNKRKQAPVRDPASQFLLFYDNEVKLTLLFI